MRRIKQLLKSLLIITTVLALVFGIAVTWPISAPEPVVARERVLITNTTVVDVRAGELVPGMNILVEGGMIHSVGRDIVSPGAQLVDGEGKYVIPGLFDMHTHAIRLSPVLFHPMMIAAGVTAVRDMGGCLGDTDPWVACAPDKRAWTKAVMNHAMVGPRFDTVTSLAINGGPEVPRNQDILLGAPNAEGARARVKHDRERGIDFLKPYTRLSRDAYLALAEQAGRHDMYLAGHHPFAVSGHELVNAGQRSVEHAFFFIWECYPGIHELRTSGDMAAAFSIGLRQTMADEHDEQACADLYRAMVEQGTAYVPTHTTRKLDAYAIDPAYREDPRLKYIPAPLRFIWLEDANAMAARAGEGNQAAYMTTYELGLRLSGAAHRAGVTVMAGTDAPDSYAFPGFGLHDELEHLVNAGLSPADALQSATLEPARFLGLEGRAGEVIPGARADLVVLSENPLNSIGAVRQIEAVMLAGAVYDREKINALLEHVEDAAGHWTMWPKFAWQMLASPIMRRQLID